MMTTESIVLHLLSRYGRGGASSAPLQANLDDLGVGLMSRAQIVVDLEERLGIKTHADAALGWTTGEEIVSFVDRALAERHKLAS